MKYAIIQTSGGNFIVKEEGFTDVSKAKTRYHAICSALWNATEVATACVMIVDENLDVVEGYKEFIYHEPVVTPTESTEPVEE